MIKKEEVVQKNWRQRKKNGMWIFMCSLFMFSSVFATGKIIPGISNVAYAFEEVNKNSDLTQIGRSEKDLNEQKNNEGVKIQKTSRTEYGATYIDWIVDFNPGFNNWQTYNPRMIVLLPSNAELVGDITRSQREKVVSI